MLSRIQALAMHVRGILRGSDVGKLDVWLDDAQAFGIDAIVRFVRTLRQDIAAVRNAITETWSNGQLEGQINRPKTLKRAMSRVRSCSRRSRGIAATG
jgi:transposase